MMEGFLCPRSAAHIIPFTLRQFCEAGMVSAIPHVGSGGTEWILSQQPYSLREGMGRPERWPVTGFTLTSSSAGRSVPWAWNAPSHGLGLCLGLRGRVCTVWEQACQALRTHQLIPLL